MLVSSAVNVTLNVTSYAAGSDVIVPGAARQLALTVSLYNLNEPDLNSDIAQIDRNSLGTNFDLDLVLTDRNMTSERLFEISPGEAVNAFELQATFTMTSGDLAAELNTSQSLEFTFTSTVSRVGSAIV